MAGTRQFDLRRSPYHKDSCVKYFLMVPAQDSGEYDIMQHFADAWAFVDRIRERRGRILIHCNLGINRCGVIVAACAMMLEKRCLLDIARVLKARRSVVLCNEGFRLQLIRFARARRMLDPYIQETSSEKQNRKAMKVVRTNSSGVLYDNQYEQDMETLRTHENRENLADRWLMEEENKDNMITSMFAGKRSESNYKKRGYFVVDVYNGSATNPKKTALSKYTKSSKSMSEENVSTLSALQNTAKNVFLSNDVMERIYKYIQPGKSESLKRNITYRKPLRSTGSTDSCDGDCDMSLPAQVTSSLSSITYTLQAATQSKRSNTSDGISGRLGLHSYCDGDTQESYTSRPKDQSHIVSNPPSHSSSSSLQPSPVVPRRHDSQTTTYYKKVSALTTKISSITSAYKTSDDVSSLSASNYIPKASARNTSGLTQFQSMLNGSSQAANKHIYKSFPATTCRLEYKAIHPPRIHVSDHYVGPYRPTNRPTPKGPPSLTIQRLAFTGTTNSRPYTYTLHQMKQAAHAI